MKNWISNLITNMSKFERMFWAVISVFILVFVVIGIINPSQTHEKIPDKEVIIFKYVIKDNLDKNTTKIIEDRNTNLEEIRHNINSEVDELFKGVEGNVDIF